MKVWVVIGRWRRSAEALGDCAYSWELWAAAYIIGGGCSDDAFSDFRSTLISMGRQTFERALADPQSLADMDYDAEMAHYEGYQRSAQGLIPCLSSS